MSGVAIGGTGRSGHDALIAVAQGGDGLRIAIAAGTGVDDGAVLGASSIGGHAVIAMPGSCHDTVGIAVATDGTGMSGVAIGGTGRSSHDALIAVAQSVDHLSVGIAASTGVDDGAVLGAGSIGGHALIAMPGGCHDAVGVAVATDGTGMGGVTIGGAGGSGHHGLIVMIRQLHASQTVVGPALHLAGLGSSDFRLRPVGPVAPTLVGELHLILGVALPIDLVHEVPGRVGTVIIAGVVAHVAGIAPQIAQIRDRVVVGAEVGVLGGLPLHRVVGVGIAPVEEQVANDLIGIDRQLLRLGLISGDLAADVVILAVQVVSGIEAGGPILHIVDGAGAHRDPLTVDQLVAIHGGGIGDHLIVVAVAILGLALEEAGIDALRDLSHPVLQILGVEDVAIAAGGADVLIVRVLGAGGLMDRQIIGMAVGSGLAVGVAVAANRAGVGGVAALGTGRSGHHAVVAMVQGSDGLGVGSPTSRAGVNRLSVLSAGGIGGNANIAVAQRRGLAVGVAVAATITGMGGVASLGAGGIRHHAYIAVAQGIALSLTAHGTGFGLGAGGIHPAVAQSRGLAVGVSITADRAGVGGVARLGAGGSGDHAVIAVAQHRHHTVGVGITTNRTGMSGVALFRASGSSDHAFIAVAQGRDRLGVAVAATVAGVHRLTILGAGGIGGDAHIVMAQRCSLAVGVAVATDRAGMGGVAALGTGGIRHHAVVVVAQRIALGSATHRAGPSLSAGGIHPAMAQSGSLVVGVSITADSAGVGGIAAIGAVGSGHHAFIAVAQSSALGLAAHGTGLSLGAGGIRPGMTQSRHLAVGVGITADRAGVGGIARLGTGGIGHNAIIAVAQRRDGLGVAVAAAMTGVDRLALLGTGGHGHHCLVAVIQSRRLTVGVAVATDRAGMGGVATLGASRIRHHAVIAMAQSLPLGGAAHRAGLFLGAGSIHPAMAQGSSLTVGIAVAADRTGVGGIARLGTSGSRGHRLVAVAQRRALSSTTDRAGLLHGAAGIDPAVAQSSHLAVGVALATDRAGVGGVARLGTGRLGHHAVVAVAGRCDRLAVTVTTSRTGVHRLTLLGTGGIGGDAFVAVAQGRDRLRVAVAAVAGVDDGTSLCTGRIGSDASIAVPGGSSLAVGVGNTANGTGMGGVARLGTGGIGHHAVVAVRHGLAAVGTNAVGIVAVVGTIHRGVAQGQGIIAVVHQGEGDLHTARDPQQLAVGDLGRVIQRSRGGLSLVALGHVPTGIVGGLHRHIAILAEDHRQGALHELILAQVGRVGAPGIVRTIDGAGEVVIGGGLFEATVGADIVLIGMDAADGAGVADAIGPAVITLHATGGTLALHPAVLTADGADGADPIGPAVGAAQAADLANAVAPVMLAAHAADGTHAIGIDVGAGLAALTNALHIAMLHRAAAQVANAIGAVALVGAVHRHIADLVGIVAVVHQGEGDDLVRRDEQLVLGGDAFGIVQGSGGDLAQVAVGHVPVQVIGGLDAHIAVHGEEHRQLAVHEQVLAQVLAVRLVGVVGPIDPAEEVVVVIGLGVAADGTNIILQAMGHRLATGGADAVRVMAVMGASCLIAQHIGIIPIVHQSEGDQLPAGDEQLVRVGDRLGVVQGGGGDVALPAGGHVPVGIVGGLHRHIAVGLEPDLQLAVHEQILAQVGVVILAGVVGTVDVAEQIVVVNRLRLAADGTNIVLIGMDALLATDGTGALLHIMLAFQTADAEAAGAVAVFHGITTDGANALSGVAGVVALHRHIAQYISIVAIVSQSEGDLRAAGHEQLIGGGQLRGVVQGDRRHIALPALGHIVGGVVRSLHAHIAVLGEEHHHLAVHELVLAQVGSILFAGVVGAVDPAEEVVVVLGLRQTAVHTDIVLIAVGAVGTAQGADTAGIIGVGGILAIHIAIQGLALHLPDVGGGVSGVGPVRPVGPPLEGVVLVVVGVALGVDVGHEEPVGVGAAGMIGAVAHIRGVTGVAAGVRGAVVSMEGGIAATLACHRVIGIAVAPVIVQVAADRVGVDHPLGGLRLGGGHLVGLVVVLGVQGAAGGETGGPAVDVLDIPGGRSHPLIPGLGPAIQGSGSGGGGLVVGVAVLLLGLDQLVGDPLRLRRLPIRIQMLRINIIAIAT